MADASRVRGGSDVRKTLAAAVAAGEVHQLADGRAGVLLGQNAGASGDIRSFTTEGQFTFTKKASVVVIDGAPMYWDHSANEATPVPPMVAGDRDFFIGCAVGDAASADTTCVVNLNVQPHYVVDFLRDMGDTVVVLTAGTPSIFNRGGSMIASFSATAEAQKLDWISKRSFTLASNWIFEGVLRVITTCDADVGDLSFGVANATHASDADSITESVFFHFDLGADLNIDCESDDGTTEVAATDSTTDFAEGTPQFFCLDGRDPSNVKYYINGVEQLAATANLGNIAVATGPLKALFHLEKSSNDSPGVVDISMMRVRTAEQ